MTLPAHRFRGRDVEERKKDDKPRSWTFDFDETITTAPKQLARIATAVRAMGDKVYVLTGNQSPRKDLIKRLDDYGFPFDELIQYQDEGTDGLRRAEYLKQLDAFCGFDDRAGRGYTYAKVCPHLFLIAKPPDHSKDDAKGGKKDAKKGTKGLRSEHRGRPVPPPNLRVSDSPEDQQPERERVDGEWVCDSWALDPDWQQDAARDAADENDRGLPLQEDS